MIFRNIRTAIVVCLLIFMVCCSSEPEDKQGWWPATWQALKTAPYRMKTAFNESIKKRYSHLLSSIHSATVAKVRSTNTVSLGEQEAITRRMKHVKKALKAKLGEFKTTPKIAVVASGGGYRASLATLGVLSALEKEGLLDVVLWNSTLSGSTWAVGSWMQAVIQHKSLSIDQHAQDFISRISCRYLVSMNRAEARQISSLLLINTAYGMPVTLVDLFGGMLSNVLFGNQMALLSSQVAVCEDGAFPIPIYTAVSAESHVPHYWYAYTPWDVAIEPRLKNTNGFSIPSWAFGREFLNKQSMGYKPEKTFGFNLGTFGSAFAANIKSLYKYTRLVNIENSFARSIIDSIIGRYGATRLTAAQVFNFTKGMKHSPFKDADTLQIVDAGLDFNLPYPPVSGMRKDRSPDILIVIDASGSVATSKQLRKMERYARTKKLKFPCIFYKRIAQHALSIFKNENDLSVPTVIYIPLVKDAALMAGKQKEFPEMKSLQALDLAMYCGTAKGIALGSGQYTSEQARQIVQLMHLNVRANAQKIWDEIAVRAGTPGLYEMAISILEYGKKKSKSVINKLGELGI